MDITKSDTDRMKNMEPGNQTGRPTSNTIPLTSSPSKTSSSSKKTEKKRVKRAQTTKVRNKKKSPETKKRISPINSVKPRTMTIKRKIVPNREVKMYIQQFLDKNISYLEKMDEHSMVKMIEYANEQYYTDSPVMNDNQYDILKEYFERKYPSNKVIHNIGAPIAKNVKNKVTLPYFMGSMDKIKPTTNAIEKFIEKYPSDYVLSVKLDGVSGLYSTENGTSKLYTRGDGRIGQDISYLIPFLRLPKQENITIRGEFIISKEIFKRHYASTFKNARNFVAGVMNSKTTDPEVMKNVDFVAYEVVEPILSPADQFHLLKTLDVDVVQHEYVDEITTELLSTKLIDWRESYSHTMDGVIVAHNAIYPRQEKNPEYAFAFKMVLTDQIAESKVVDVLWAPSKDGYLKPRIRIEPIELGGVTIEYATAFNASFVVEKKLNMGAVVKIIRSGDVIPYIQEVVEPAEFAKMPDIPYHWNDTHVDIIMDNKEDSDEVLEKNITSFFQTIKVKHLGEGNVRKLIKHGYRTIDQILGMSKTDFLKVDGIQDKTASNLHTGIMEQVLTAELPVLMTASNKFEHGFGTKKFETILAAYPDILVSIDSDVEKIGKLSNVKSIAMKTATHFVEHIHDFVVFLEECKLTYKLETNSVVENDYDINHVLFQKHIVMTGFRDDDFVKMLKDTYQMKDSSSVTKNTFVLLVKSHDDNSGKTQKATTLGIPIMTKAEFTNAFLH